MEEFVGQKNSNESLLYFVEFKLHSLCTKNFYNTTKKNFIDSRLDVEKANAARIISAPAGISVYSDAAIGAGALCQPCAAARVIPALPLNFLQRSRKYLSELEILCTVRSGARSYHSTDIPKALFPPSLYYLHLFLFLGAARGPNRR